MATTDIIILLFLLGAGISGLFKGFISQAIALVSIFAGAWLAFHFSQTLCCWACQYLTGVSEEVMNIIAFIIIFIVTVALISLVGKFFKKILKIALLGWLDRLLGAALALVVGIMIAGLIIVLFDNINTMFEIVDKDILSESVLFNPIKELAYQIFPYLKALIFKQ